MVTVTGGQFNTEIMSQHDDTHVAVNIKIFICDLFVIVKVTERF